MGVRLLDLYHILCLSIHHCHCPTPDRFRITRLEHGGPTQTLALDLFSNLPFVLASPVDTTLCLLSANNTVPDRSPSAKERDSQSATWRFKHCPTPPERGLGFDLSASAAALGHLIMGIVAIRKGIQNRYWTYGEVNYRCHGIQTGNSSCQLWCFVSKIRYCAMRRVLPQISVVSFHFKSDTLDAVERRQ
jgi:hypothetical protein